MKSLKDLFKEFQTRRKIQAEHKSIAKLESQIKSEESKKVLFDCDSCSKGFTEEEGYIEYEEEERPEDTEDSIASCGNYPDAVLLCSNCIDYLEAQTILIA